MSKLAGRGKRKIHAGSRSTGKTQGTISRSISRWSCKEQVKKACFSRGLGDEGNGITCLCEEWNSGDWRCGSGEKVEQETKFGDTLVGRWHMAGLKRRTWRKGESSEGWRQGSRGTRKHSVTPGFIPVLFNFIRHLKCHSVQPPVTRKCCS